MKRDFKINGTRYSVADNDRFYGGMKYALMVFSPSLNAWIRLAGFNTIAAAKEYAQEHEALTAYLNGQGVN